MHKASHVRGVVRFLAFTVWTLALGGFWLCIRFVFPPDARSSGGALILSRWSRGVRCIVGLRLEVSGKPLRCPVLLASNHISYLDIAVIASEVPVVFVSKSEVAGWPLLGPLAKAIGTIFLERDRPRSVIEVAERMGKLLKSGQSIAMFPEGTTKKESGISDLRPALFEPALRAEIPIQGVSLEYIPLSKSDNAEAAWYGEATFLPHFYRFLCGGRWVARLKFNEAGFYADRHEAAQMLRTWMESSLVFGKQVA